MDIAIFTNMIKNSYTVIGVMSGTSLDGMDLVYHTLFWDNQWHYKIHAAETVPYTEEWKIILSDLPNKPVAEIKKLDANYTIYLAEIIQKFIEKYQINNVDLVASHGHTALHQPNLGITYQIGNLPIIAEILNTQVVCDFRVQDVALGGQGAPLVPIGDALLFAEYDFCLNLGGFANLSTTVNKNRIAYDICPVNIALNYYMQKLGKDFDDKGQLAATGKINQTLLNSCNALPFYKKSYPKSLGYEWVLENIFPKIEKYNLKIPDILRTLIAHISYQITHEINKKRHAKVLVTGGGAFNDFLISEINKRTKNKLVIPDPKIIAFKEALIFGLLGVLKLREETNCLSSVTGAIKNHSTGKIYIPKKQLKID